MAGMEQLEIHSKAYIVRWVKVDEGHTISWSVQPHKKSINFGIVKHPSALGGAVKPPSLGVGDENASPNSLEPPALDVGKPPRRLSTLQQRPERNETQSTAQEQLQKKGFILKNWFGKCEADKVSMGTYPVGGAQGGMYGLIFDNTFSKTVSKTATFVLLTYPSNAPPNSTHHLHNLHGSQGTSMASAMSTSKVHSSPKLGATKASDSVDSLHSQPMGRTASRTTSVSGRGDTAGPPSTYHVGMLQKRRRKKGQGYARRYFSLDFVSCTLSYYYSRNSSALRGAIPLSLAAIAADERRKEISIDSGAEIWHLKASNVKDFEEWTTALETASSTARGLTEGPVSPAKLHVHTSGIGYGTANLNPEEEREWEQVESLVSRIVGTRDAVRRLVKDSKPPNKGLGLSNSSSPVFPQEEGDYFSVEKRPFWKRKASSSTPRIFERSPSTSLAVPSTSSTVTAGSAGSSPVRKSKNQSHAHEEQGMHEHCSALLNDLDSVLGEFSELIASSKRRRIPVPHSAMSRLSVDTTATEMFYDAEGGEQDSSQLLMLSRHSDEDTPDSDHDEFVSDTTSISSGAEESLAEDKPGSASFFPPKPKSLAPLPITSSIKRRRTVEPARVLPPSLIAFLRKNVGKDFSTISMPVSANEPTSLLQRLAENLEYADLLTAASQQSQDTTRLLYVAAFAVSTFANGRAKERAIRKPFNPMLGETFELIRGEDEVPGGFRFIAEKVSHRPVKLACQADSASWSFSHSPVPTQKFWGKSAEIITEGRIRVVLRLKGGEDECYSWPVATVFLRNVVMGEKYVEPVGTMNVMNESSGAKATIEFKTKGMFGGRSEDVQVDSYDANGSPTGSTLTGNWTTSLRLVEGGKGAGTEIWKARRLVDDSANRYGFTEFAAQLNEITEVEAGKLAPTDSRLRKDQQAAERGELDLAEEQKKKLEEAQRERRAEYESEGKEWMPRWFTRIDADEEVWRLKGGKEGYWEERHRGHWAGVEDVLLVGRDVHGKQGAF